MKKFHFVALGLFIACEFNSRPLVDEAKIDEYLSQYAPYEMHFDASVYEEEDKLVLRKLVQAAAYVDTIYWLQTSKYGIALRDSLEMLQDDPYAKKLLTLVKRNAGPFELLDDHERFMGSQIYYAGDEVYPRGMTADKFDVYYETLTDEEKSEFLYPYTVIREDGEGGYKAVRYYEEYKRYVDSIVKLLHECADLSTNKSFAKFLRLKAEALMTDDYFDADVAWIDVEGSKFDIVLGPFETYSDGIKGVKAKYEAYVEIVDQNESEKMDMYTQYLQRLEENLPIPRDYKSVVEGLTAKFVVVRDIVRAGEGAAGYQAVAANLPNDPEVHKRKGTKKTFWKNMFEARFNVIIKPVGERLINESQLPYLSDEGFFQFVLMHEICHAIGPRTVKVGAQKGKAVNAAIGPNYNALEEAKANIVGLYSLAYFIDKRVVDPSKERMYYVSFLGSAFRSIRFGLGEAHGKAAAIELNYLQEHGGIQYDENTRRWSIEFDNFRGSVRNLARELLILEGDGDNQKVQEFFDRWAVLTPIMRTSLDSVQDIAIDVLPRYSIKWD